MNKRQAFSLIELSIVILIIGILIAGVTQGSRLVTKFRLSTARTLTQSSPVNGIKDLVTWYDSTSEASYITYPDNGDAVPTWKDINPQSIIKNDATQGTTTSQPRYTEGAINGLPALRSDGVDDYYNFNGNVLVGGVNNGYTIFVVEARRGGGNMMFIGSNGSNVTNGKFSCGYLDSATIYFDQYNNGTSVAVATYTIPTPRVHTFISAISLLSSPAPASTTKAYFLNGVVTTLANPSTAALISDNTATIGSIDGNSFNGDFGEIIIFARTLKNEERAAVEQYLGKKWGIKIG